MRSLGDGLEKPGYDAAARGCRFLLAPQTKFGWCDKEVRRPNWTVGQRPLGNDRWATFGGHLIRPFSNGDPGSRFTSRTPTVKGVFLSDVVAFTGNYLRGCIKRVEL